MKLDDLTEKAKIEGFSEELAQSLFAEFWDSQTRRYDNDRELDFIVALGDDDFAEQYFSWTEKNFKTMRMQMLKQSVQAVKTSPLSVSDVKKTLDYQTVTSANGSIKQKLIQSVRNMQKVLEKDPHLTGCIGFDEFARCDFFIDKSTGNMRPWEGVDDSKTFGYIQAEYGLRNRQDFFDGLKVVSHKNAFHPVRDLLDGLAWDGKPHIENLLHDFLGADNNQYNRSVFRLWMLGAVSRIFEPGCKFDYVIILQGSQGIGKSSFLQILSLNDSWFCDSLDGLDSDKAAQALLGSWIIELAELKSLTRTVGGVDSIKRFLSANQDKFRQPYERRAEIFPRSCVFAGSTNRLDFLQDETGNRRFLIVPVGIEKPTRNIFAKDTPGEMRQAWAEAVHIYKTEKPCLVLPQSVADEAERLQSASLSEDGTRGLIENFLQGRARTCVLEVWEQCLGESGRPAKWQSSEISTLITQLPGWTRQPNPTTFGKYGRQRWFKFTAP